MNSAFEQKKEIGEMVDLAEDKQLAVKDAFAWFTESRYVIPKGY